VRALSPIAPGREGSKVAGRRISGHDAAMLRSFRAACLPLALLSLARPAAAADPVAPPAAADVPDARDVAWPAGAIALDVDATDVKRGLYRVTETIPLPPQPAAQPGSGAGAGSRRITLLFPEWLPGNHAPRGPLAELADLRFSVGGKPAAWVRDPLDVYAFHVDVPSGASELVARFVHTSPLNPGEGRITMTGEMLNLQWEKMSLYPAGHYVRRIPVRAAVTLPQGWSAATSLPGRTFAGNRVSWAETDYETLVDSPVFAGRWYRRWDLGNAMALDVVADDPDLLALSAENLGAISRLGGQALSLFGRPPFERYDFLVALSDRIGGIGLEHLASSENQLEPRNFVDWKAYDWDRNVLAHELVHAWNGKYRRPADLWTPDYRQPMQDSLLWVYEGQTQFWGWVLAARSGLQQKDTVLGMIAAAAGAYAALPGREWRSVADTTNDPIIAARKPRPFGSITRGEDYYNEGALVWLEADQLIRAGTNGAKGLDDFARAFFSARGDGARQATYRREDVVAALSAVMPHDWEAFLRARIDRPGAPAPLAGIEAGGYRLVWKTEPNPYERARMDHARSLGLAHSLGLTIDRDGTIADVRWGSAAFDAGMVKGARIIAVDALAYDPERLKRAITAARGTSRPIEFIVQRGDRFTTVPVRYNGGLRWPWLERAAPGKGPAGLDVLLEAK